MSIKISSQFDAGAIDVVSATSAGAIDLNIRKDSHADITQWFYFRLQGAQGEACTHPLPQRRQDAPIRTAGTTTRRWPATTA